MLNSMRKLLPGLLGILLLLDVPPVLAAAEAIPPGEKGARNAQGLAELHPGWDLSARPSRSSAGAEAVSRIHDLKERMEPVPLELYRQAFPSKVEPAAGGARQGGEHIGDATVIPELPFTDWGTTEGYQDDYDEVCPYEGSTSPDVVYVYTPPQDQLLTLSLCGGSDYDTKLYVYAGEATPGAPYACNDDACPGWTSEITGLQAIAGLPLFIVVDGYGGQAGNYVLDVFEEQPCDPVFCTGTPEQEPNGGPPEFGGEGNFGQASCGETICGQTWAQGDSLRDTDWFEIILDESAQIQLHMDVSEFDGLLFVIGEGPEYRIVEVMDANPDCQPEDLLSDCLLPGLYYIWVGHNDFGGVETPVDYALYVDCFPCTWLDPCETAEVAECDATLSGSTAGAVNYAGNPSGDALYLVDIPVASTWTFSTCDLGTDFDTVIRLYDDCPAYPGAAELASNDDYCDTSSELEYEFTEAGQYWLLVEGNYTYEGEYTLTIWCILPDAVIDITKSPVGWWPEYGNTVTYTARVYWEINGICIFPGPASIIMFDLTDISHERGYSLNMGTKTHGDLHMNHAANYGSFVATSVETDECDFAGNHEHWEGVMTTDCVTEATVTVQSEDFGSFGWIEASGIRCDNGMALGTILPREPGGGVTCISGPAKTKIPRDDNGNDIEDTWWGDATNGTSPTWDDEQAPNGTATSRGDGLTRYEEWRGPHVMGSHMRLLTLTKELFVYRENAAWGVEDVDVTADIHFITANEFNGALHDPGPGTVHTGKGPRIVNFNRTSHTKVDQHGMWLAVIGGDGNRNNWGLCRDANGGTAGPMGPPFRNGRVEIYSANISAACASRVSRMFRHGAGARRGSAWFVQFSSPRTNEMIGDIIGHEGGHCLDARHHTTINNTVRRIPDTGIFSIDDPAVVARNTTQDWPSQGAARNCVMRYPFREIARSLGLIYHPRGNYWRSRSPGWGLLPVANHGYGGEPTCLQNVKIDDTD